MTTQVDSETAVEGAAKSPLTRRQASLNRFGRRSFLQRLGIGGAASLLPLGGFLTAENQAQADNLGFGGGLTRGDVAILQFLAAAEILETDLWQQYNELALG